MSKGITERTEELASRKWEPGVEMAPSVLKDDEPTLARSIGLAGACGVIFGGAALMFNTIGWSERVGIGSSTVILVAGLVGMLFHAVYDRDLQVRRLYWGGGLGLLALGGLLCLVPAKGGVGGLFGLGYPALGVALLFLLAVLHHEHDVAIRDLTVRIIGGVGLLGALVAFILGNDLKGMSFLVPYGTLLAVMALIYLTTFVSKLGISSDLGYRAGLGIGAIGLAVFLDGLLRSLFDGSYLVPGGLLYLGLGLLYMMVSVAMCSDYPLVVMSRRELAAYFFSPLVYLALAGFTAVAWFYYRILLAYALHPRIILPEPITEVYLWGLGPILTLTFLVPVLTMRLLSEEKRTGSLEVLLTAPVKEHTVVLSKFIAALLLYLILWAPWWLFLVALRIGGGQPFDYRSLFSFVVALSVTGAAFMSMGLFFSSLTSNQVAAAVLTFAMMMLYLGVYLLKGQFQETPNSPWVTILNHIDYVELWRQAAKGILVPKFLLFQLSVTLVWLFLTVKVLEARRWA